MFPSTMLFASLLAWNVMASPVGLKKRMDDSTVQPDHPIVIGYRTVNSIEAKAINLDYSPVYNAAFDQTPGWYGSGKSLSGHPGDFVMTGSWYCAIAAPKSAWATVNKAWIPKDEGDNGEALIRQYIKSGKLAGAEADSKTWDAAETVRFGPMTQASTRKTFNELLLPNALLAKKDGKNDFGLYGVCAETVAKLYLQMKAEGLPTADMDYVKNTASWKIKGTPPS